MGEFERRRRRLRHSPAAPSQGRPVPQPTAPDPVPSEAAHEQPAVPPTSQHATPPARPQPIGAGSAEQVTEPETKNGAEQAAAETSAIADPGDLAGSGPERRPDSHVGAVPGPQHRPGDEVSTGSAAEPRSADGGPAPTIGSVRRPDSSVVLVDRPGPGPADSPVAMSGPEPRSADSPVTVSPPGTRPGDSPVGVRAPEPRPGDHSPVGSGAAERRSSGDAPAVGGPERAAGRPSGGPAARRGTGARPTSGAGAGGIDDRDSERGLRGLVGSGSSQVSVGAAMRARDAARPTDADLAEAEERLVIVRRNWLPREDLPRNR